MRVVYKELKKHDVRGAIQYANQFNLVIKLAKRKGISVSLHYEEGCDTWYWRVISAGGRGNFIGKSQPTFELATQDIIGWFNN